MRVNAYMKHTRLVAGQNSPPRRLRKSGKGGEGVVRLVPTPLFILFPPSVGQHEFRSKERGRGFPRLFFFARSPRSAFHIVTIHHYK